MKLVILTSRFPYPLEKGDKLRIYHQIRELSRWHDITLIALAEHPVAVAHLQHMQQFCQQIFVFPLRKYQIALNIIRGWLQGMPLQVAYFYSPYLKKCLSKTIREISPDYLYCQLVRMAPYVEDLPLPKTLDYMDAFSAGMQRRANRSRGLLKVVFNLESARLRKYETQVFAKFDHSTIISEQDRDLLQIAQKKQIHVVPNGVDTRFFRADPRIAKSYHLAFVGNMGYHPNVEAAKFLVLHVLPILQKEIPDIKILIAGARPTAEVKSLQNEQVTVSGWLDDIRDAYSAAQVFVAPIFLGSGQQNKILEAMSMGLPGVTTSMVNNAIGAPVNKAIFVANSAAEFAEQILLLLAKTELQKATGQAAREFVEQKYSWQHSVSIFAELFKKNSLGNEF